jgi:hypothetical protein
MPHDSYVLVVRHGRHDRGHLRPDAGPDGTGRFPVESVAERLREILTIDPTMVLTRLAERLHAVSRPRRPLP